MHFPRQRFLPGSGHELLLLRPHRAPRSSPALPGGGGGGGGVPGAAEAEPERSQQPAQQGVQQPAAREGGRAGGVAGGGGGHPDAIAGHAGAASPPPRVLRGGPGP